MTSSSFFGGERKHSHFPKLKSEKVKILTLPSIFADGRTKITVMENILHAFSLDKTKPQILPIPTSVWYLMEGRAPRPPNQLSLSGVGKIIVNLLPNPWQNTTLMILLVGPSYSQRMNKEKGLMPP